MRSLGICLFLSALAMAAPARAADCAADNRTRVQAGEECLVIQAYGEPAEKTKLVIFIHGDGSSGGPSDYLYKTAKTFGRDGVVAVGLIRPGYFDREKNYSTGNAYRTGDGYRPDVIATVAAAITTLKAHYKAERVVLAGHSGGAAISAVILGKHPGLVDAAVLAACPCNVPEWRTQRRRRPWDMSLSPHDFIAAIPAGTEIIAVTGGNDDNTAPELAKGYVEQAKARGIKAEFIGVLGVTHNGSARSQEFKDAVGRLIGG
jgi:pimeloyl-ACP methyl ester carboxylesterase